MEAVVVVEEDLLFLEGEEEEEVFVEDLILEILLRLPPVSVIRFKSVSKSWYSLFSNPCFLQNHARLLKSQNRFLVDPLVLISNARLGRSNYRGSTKLSVIPTQEQEENEPEKPPTPYLKVFLDHSLAAFRQKFSRCFLVDSCNGLLLYHTINHKNLDTRYQYIVFNPIINEYAEVPIMGLLRNILPNIEKPVLLNCPHILFDPSISLSYKVLTVVPKSHGGRYELYVYSSDTASWRLMRKFIANFRIGKQAFMLNGVFYWFVESDFAICYDIVKENVCQLSLPPRPTDTYREVFYFGECGGRLRLINEYFTHGLDSSLRLPFSFDIMEKDLCSTVWTLKFRVNIEGGYEHLIRRSSTIETIDVRIIHLYQTERGEEVVLLRLSTAGQKMIVSFNITTNTFRKEITFQNSKQAGSLNAFPFTPTLFPLLT